MEQSKLNMKQILVVDDSRSVREHVALILQQSGYACLQAPDGIQALSLLKKHDVALIICDVNMPGISGLALVTHLRQSEPEIPCLMLSVEGDPQMLDRARRAGATGWIVKPFKSEQLVEAVRVAISG